MMLAWYLVTVFVGIPFGWALVWAFCVAVKKWEDT